MLDQSAICSLVNGLLIEVHRSLLQYTAEASPWSADADAAVCSRVVALAEEQEKSVSEMFAFLKGRHHYIKFGVYPAEYTSLHFVSLNYLLRRLKDSAAALVDELESAVGQLAGDGEAVKLVESVIAREKEIQSVLNDVSLTGVSTLL